MKPTPYDIVTAGGGLGGATVAAVMARAGARVLVVERETRFQDRVRGEILEPWEARRRAGSEFTTPSAAPPTTVRSGKSTSAE
jgi:flavin-dependent dehydrogenase